MSSPAPTPTPTPTPASDTTYLHQLPEPYNKILTLQDALPLWNRLKDIPHDNALALVRAQLVSQIKQLENSFAHEIHTNSITLHKLIQSIEPIENATISKSKEIDSQLRRLYTMVKDKRLAIEQVILAAAPPRQPDEKQPPPQSRPPIHDKNPNQFYTKIRTLRQTLFGKLKLFTRHSDSRLVAIKLSSKQLVFERKTIGGQTVSENPQQELNVLRRLNSGGGHRHILQLIEELEDEQYYWTVLEFAGKGEFFDLIKRERFSDERTRHYFLQMCQGVMHMHACGYCHLDLSLENLLMDDHDELKICDFGLSREFLRCPNDETLQLRKHQHEQLRHQLTHITNEYKQHHTQMTTEQQTHAMTTMQTLSLQMYAVSINRYGEIKFQGEPHNKPGKIAYMSPEIFQGRDFDGRSCDVWSMGIILFMSLTGVPPFNHPAVSDQRFRHIYTGAIDTLLKAWGMLEVVSPAARDLISRMLAPADRRITMEEILQHPWVTLQDPSQHQQPPS